MQARIIAQLTMAGIHKHIGYANNGKPKFNPLSQLFYSSTQTEVLLLMVTSFW